MFFNEVIMEYVYEMVVFITHPICVVTLLSLIISLIVSFRPFWRPQNGIKEIPGPRALLFFGTTWFFWIRGYRLNESHKFYEDLYAKYGPIVKEEALFNFPLFNIFEKEAIEKVLKLYSRYPLRPPMQAQVMYRKSRPDRYASAGLVNEQGEKWYYLRTTLTPRLTSPRIMFIFSDEANVIGEEWSNLLGNKRNPDMTISNLENLVVLLGIESICALVLGKRLESLHPEAQSEESLQLAKAIQDNFRALRDTEAGLQLWKYFKTPAYKLLEKSEEQIYETALKIINNQKQCNSEVYQSIVNAHIDKREKTAVLVDFIAAGIHTLKNSFLFLLYLVAKNPQVQEKILDDQNYAKACVLESYRLLPTATPLARIIEKSVHVGNYQLKAGSVILCHNEIACKNEAYFEEARVFKPERWSNPENNNAAAFLVSPFGTGRRICPGHRFIDLILPIFLQHTIKNFKITTEQDLEIECEYLRAPKGDIIIQFADRF